MALVSPGTPTYIAILQPDSIAWRESRVVIPALQGCVPAHHDTVRSGVCPVDGAELLDGCPGMPCKLARSASTSCCTPSIVPDCGVMVTSIKTRW